jgi:hypothetical protein
MTTRWRRRVSTRRDIGDREAHSPRLALGQEHLHDVKTSQVIRTWEVLF